MARKRAITAEDLKAIWRMFAPPPHVPREPARPSFSALDILLNEPARPYSNALYRWLKKKSEPGPSPDISRYMAGDT